MSYHFSLVYKLLKQNKGIFISKTKYIKDTLKKFQRENPKLVATPMDIACKLSKDNEFLDVDQKRYRYTIEGLLYLTIS